MLIAVRHNRTSYNEDGKEKMRGWLDIPLSKEGIQESYDTAAELKKIKLPIDDFYTSPLRRAIMTANEIENELEIYYKPKKELRDWDVGILTGKSVDSTLGKIH